MLFQIRSKCKFYLPYHFLEDIPTRFKKVEKLWRTQREITTPTSTMKNYTQKPFTRKQKIYLQKDLTSTTQSSIFFTKPTRRGRTAITIKPRLTKLQEKYS